jgi:tRNA(Leu) C34 or U34 (ribose-2'-O)-methylase TrmL
MFGIGLIDCKNAWNLGNALRSTVAYGGTFFAVQGTRWQGTGDWTKTDTEGAWNTIPCYLGVKNIFEVLPTNAVDIVAVELTDDAENIINFAHPKNAVYLFGAEDNSISKENLERCHKKIFIPTRYCLNLATCVACVAHDRMIKTMKNDKFSCPKCGKSHLKKVDEYWHCNACGHDWR